MAADRTITSARFMIDGKAADAPVALRDCAGGCLAPVPKNAAIATVRAVSVTKAGLHTFSVSATQSDGQTVTANGNFEVVALLAGGQKVKNIVILLGDGLGAAQRTAARIVAGGYAQGKVITPLAMDTFPVTGMVKTASLNSVVTDSAPGMTSYVSGNKKNNNEEGVFPDDTTDPFDNPRIEYLSEYLHRTQGKALGLVTTSDVFDATPAGNAVHTSSRGAERWMLDTIEFDRAVKVAQLYAVRHGDTLVIATADHECSGVALIGGSRVSDARLQELVRESGTDNLRDKVVGIYEQAGFPKYRMAGDGYPETTDIDNRLLVGYGANSDRFEDWRTNERPVQDSQQPFVKSAPLSAYPAGPSTRDMTGSFQITGQVPGDSAVHTATDIPLSAFGPGAWAFTGVMDNTDVFFRLAQAAVGGAVIPEWLAAGLIHAPVRSKRKSRYVER